MIRISQIKVPVDSQETAIKKAIAKTIKDSNFEFVRIVKKSIDARDKNNLLFIYTVDIKSPNENKILQRFRNNNNIMLTKNESYIIPYKNISYDGQRPIIIGAGPAGYFCGLYLSRMGFKPIIFERGCSVDERVKCVEDFWNGGAINPESNVSFGEGGAGTFSDGKLNTGIKDPLNRIKAVINDFVSFGAPLDISYLAKPHIGTDELRVVLKNMRQEIVNNGGEVHFNHKFIDYAKSNTDKNEIIVSILNQITNKISTHRTNSLILAIGHSARDTFRMLYNNKLNMEPKSFAIGVRIEHKRDMIDKSQYGNSDKAKLLPAADYKMTFRSSEGRSVYSFCMCPGGFVVNASSGDNQSVVNGMSNHGRDEVNSNSAIVVNVTPKDFCNEGFGDSPLSGVLFQESYEKKAFDEGKGKIPVQTFIDFKQNKVTEQFGDVTPNIKGLYTFGNLNNCLPSYVNNAIIEGIEYYDRKLCGFGREDSILSGIESRTSSPVRIIRNDDFMSDYKGVFPCGEGAGYAGGITSAAVDGIKVAEAVASYLINNI